jgi:rubrerythrin
MQHLVRALAVWICQNCGTVCSEGIKECPTCKWKRTS